MISSSPNKRGFSVFVPPQEDPSDDNCILKSSVVEIPSLYFQDLVRIQDTLRKLWQILSILLQTCKVESYYKRQKENRSSNLTYWKDCI